jgi:hypothetical protein
MHHNKNHTIHDKILNAINAGELKMRPRWYFIFRNTLFALGALLVILILLYMISFIIFILHRNGLWFVPVFGFQALGIFLFSLPWILILIALIFIFVLEILVKQYAFAYRRPLLYSALGAIGIVFVGGFVIAQSPLHHKFFVIARQGNLPFAGGFYRDFAEQRFKDIHPCTITEITQDGFKAEDNHDEMIEVIIGPETRFPYGTNFSVQDRVLVIGPQEDQVIKAVGIRKIDNNIEYFEENSSAPKPVFKIRFEQQNP